MWDSRRPGVLSLLHGLTVPHGPLHAASHTHTSPPAVSGVFKSIFLLLKPHSGVLNLGFPSPRKGSMGSIHGAFEPGWEKSWYSVPLTSNRNSAFAFLNDAGDEL